MAQQGVELGLAAAKGLERLHGRTAAAHLQNGLQVALSGGAVGQAVGIGAFLKRGIGVGTQHLGPLVAVIAGRITTRKDVAEGVGAAAPGRRLQHRDLRAHPLLQGQQILARVVFRVKQHVKQRELDLAQGLHPAMEVFGGQHLVKQGPRQGFTGVYMSRHVAQHIPLPAKILHELAGQFHRVPFHAADARDIALVDLGQQVVQAVSELMKQGRHIVMGEQRRLTVHAAGKVADQVRHRGLQLLGVWAQPARARVVHPGAAAFASAGAWVEVEVAKQLAGALDAVKAHVHMPKRRCIWADADIKQGFYDLEQAGEHLGGSEIGLNFLLAESVAGLFEFLADIGPVPGLWVGKAEFGGGKFAQVAQVLLCEGPGPLGQIAQKPDHLFG